MTPRGAFSPEPGDGVPEVVPGVAAATLVLAGNAGPAMWQAFTAERDPTTDTLDDWSKAKLGPVAEQLGARAFYPFEPPHLPFQRWAMRAEACHPSPLGMFIHPVYGLWHGYRGASALAERLETCPVEAFAAEGYDVAACTRHLETPAGADCMAEGCRARRACPVGTAHTYAPAQAAFHMKAFLEARRRTR